MFRPDLIRHNLLVSYRSFLHNKNTFFINLTGLSTGLACVFLIFLWVNDELHVDKFFEHDKQLFQVLQSVQGPNGIETIEATPGPLARTLKEEMPEIQYATSVIPATFNVGQGVVGVEDIRFKAAGKYASRDFFQVFSYRLLQGERSEVLSEKNGVVISEALALRLFQGSENAIGRTIDWQANGIAGPCMISGVFADPPPNATDRFDLVLNYQWYLDHFPEAGWGDSSPRSFVLLKHGTRSDGLQGKIKNFIHTKDDHSNAVLTLQRYSDRYLYDHFENGEVAGGRIEYVRLFMVIAFFILAIACINFMNLSTAKASARVKEVGVKKVVGAGRGLLVVQYLTESLLIAGLSLVTAVLIALSLIPGVNAITGKSLQLGFTSWGMLGMLGITFSAGILAGAYPALFLSGHNAITVLKGQLKSSTGERWVRKGLILFQFTVSMLLIVSVVVVYKQIELIQSGRNLGYNRDHVVYFSVDQPGKAFAGALRNIPGVISVGGGSLTAGKQLGGTNDVRWAGKEPDDQTFFSTFWLGYDLIETLGIEIKEGHSFSEAFGSPYQAILNEEAVRRMGLQDPLGKTLQVGGDEREVVGIVNDFYFESFYETVKPCILLLAPMEYAPKLSVRIRAGTEKATIAKLKAVYEAYYPGLVFDYKFMDEDYQKLYASEKRVAVLSRYFAGMAVVISCLGLFGLAMFTTDRRKKEIGIRKVMGAGVFGIIRMLTGGFTKIVLFAVALALPAGYWLATHWLAQFTLHIGLYWWYFLGPAVLLLIIAWATVGVQTVRAARVNPVKSLKEE
ncbi:MAG: ABC transporter permease [Lewinella sp.]|nr:ABC transporter permease [Lewinella sp.]